MGKDARVAGFFYTIQPAAKFFEKGLRVKVQSNFRSEV